MVCLIRSRFDARRAEQVPKRAARSILEITHPADMTRNGRLLYDGDRESKRVERFEVWQP